MCTGLSYGSDETAANRHKTSERIKSHPGAIWEATTYSKLASLISRDAVCKTTTLSDEFTFEKYKEQNGNRLIPLFAIPQWPPCPFTPPQDAETGQRMGNHWFDHPHGAGVAFS